MEQERQERREQGLETGFSLVEVTLGLTLLMIGLLGFVGAIVSTQIMVRVTKETNIANAAIISTIEEFRDACATDFVGAINSYVEVDTGDGNGVLSLDRLAGIGEEAMMTSVIVLDESELTPGFDLDGDGVVGSYLVEDEGEVVQSGSGIATAETANAAVLRIRVSWTGVRGPMEVEYTTIVAKGEIE